MKFYLEVSQEGPFLFASDPGRIIRRNLGQWFDQIAKEGAAEARRTVRGGMKDPQNPPHAFTPSDIEGPSRSRSPRKGGSDGPIYAKVRMMPGLSRGGSAKYPAARVPYIVARVLEGGHYGGTIGKQVRLGGAGKTRRRTRWHSATAQNRFPIRYFAAAYRLMKGRIGTMPDLTKELD